MAKTVLVVDDSKFIRNQIKKALSDCDFNIVEASNGRQALTSLTENVVDFVITDLVMPGVDGLQLIKQIKEKGIAIPVIVLTADIQDAVRNECLELGAVSFLSKPFVPEQLIATVRKIA